MDAVYVSATSCTVSGDLTSIFVHGRRLYADCGVDGMKYVTTSGSSYGDPNTTVTIYESELTANLADVEWSKVKPGSTGNMPRHKHDSTEGEGGPIDYNDLNNTPDLSTYATDAELTTTSGDLSSEIDSDISTHEAGSSHDSRYYTESELDGGQLDNRYYTEAEVDALTWTESDITDLDKYTQAEVDTISGSLSSEIDSDISTHAGLPNAHHNRSHAITSTDDHTANNWKILYTDGSGNIQELALGATSGDSLTTTGASSAPEWTTVSGGGGVATSWTTNTQTTTGTVTVTTGDSSETFVSTVSAGTVTYNLPSVSGSDLGTWFTFVKAASGTVTIDAADSDIISDSSAGGTLFNDHAGETYAVITLQLVTETKWVLTGGHGHWETT